MNSRIVLTLLSAAILAAGLGCGDSPTTSDGDEYNPVIDPSNFVAGVDNPFFPLPPGRKWIYEGDGERVEVTVTDDTKTILGVTCLVVRDQVFVDGELLEDTFDWYAQDKDGNVWYMGEDTKEYENGVVVSTEGSWEAGVDGAKPGIIMKAEPQVGDEYRQEYYEDEAEDMARVESLTASVTLAFGTFTDCIRTREFTPLEPGIAENKFYASGIGNVLTMPVGGSERSELVSMTDPPTP